jgi:LytB protein
MTSPDELGSAPPRHVAPEVDMRAADRRLRVVDAACPLVSKVHAEAHQAARRGDTVVHIGHPEHEEVEGTRGEAPAPTVLVATADEVAGVDVADPARVPYLTQATLAVDETAAVVVALTARFPPSAAPRAGTAATPRPTARPPCAPSPSRPSSCRSSARRAGAPHRRSGRPPAGMAHRHHLGRDHRGCLRATPTGRRGRRRSAPPRPGDRAERVTAVEDVHFNPPVIGDPR